MEVLGAFMACALISVLTQLMVECIRGIHGPTLFLFVQAVGALLVPLGAIAALQAFGQAGMVITVFNAGATVCADVIDIIGGGDPSALAILLGVFLAVAVMGIAAGALRVRVVARKGPRLGKPSSEGAAGEP